MKFPDRNDQTLQPGLSEKEVLVRQKKYGLNEITTLHANMAAVLARQAKSPFFYLIVAAGAISFLAGEKIDGIVIMATMAANVAIGFFQEYRAEHALNLLKKFIPEKARVTRAGKSQLIEKKEVVPGDLLELSAGDSIPADARSLKTEQALVDESILTGESLPVSKSAGDMLFAGTFVMAGNLSAVCVATGKNTKLGEIATLVAVPRRISAYEKSVVYFCRLVLKIVLATIILMFVANIFLKGFGGFFNLALFSVALIISILPEALPAVVTFALSKGSLIMAKKHVVVRRLSAIEDLGNIEILCTDKTGTLTENRLTLEKVVSSNQKKCFLYGMMGDSASNPFHPAMAKKASEHIVRAAEKLPILSEVPFDSFRMMSSVLTEGQIMVVKGAPEIILKKCASLIAGFTRAELREYFESEAVEGKRVLAVAYKKHGGDAISKKNEKALTFLGYFVFKDPLKQTAAEAIKVSKKLGVAVKIITGDSAGVAAYVGKKIGLIQNSKEVVSGEALALMVKDDFAIACEDFSVFARVSPGQKYDIIKALQKKYEVGFLGEGINDAPALKLADVAIAVPSASDVSRQVADVVMLQKDLRVIVEGIKEGRVIFANINKYIKCTLSANFGNFYSVATVSLFITYLPMLPVQILLGNLLSDFPLISIATDSVDIEELRKPKMYQLHMVLPLIISLALVSTVFDFIFFTMFFRSSPGTIQTLWFAMSVLTELGLIFIIRTRKQFWKAKQPTFLLLSFMIISAVAVIVLPFLSIGQKLFHFAPPTIGSLLAVFGLVIVYFATSEVVKLIYFRYFKLRSNGSMQKMS